MMDQNQTDARIEADEGTGPQKGGRFVVYDDANGKPIVPGSHVIGHPTIGYGRALDVNGISPLEAAMLLHDTEGEVEAQLDKVLPWWRQQSDVRQCVMLSLAYNMGVGDGVLGTGLLGFKHALASWQAGDFIGAAAGFKDSRWYTQVGNRALRLCAMLMTNSWA